MEQHDRITLAGMSFTGRHGVGEQEQAQLQPFVVTVEFPVDAAATARTDDIETTVDYAAVFECVREIVEEQSYNLIETLAESIAAQLLERFPIATVTVRLQKPNAPLPGAFDHVEIAIHRRRPE